MSKRITVVIGKNFGDEGKGLATDYFTGQIHAAQIPGALVIKHNGGAQAGHTVDRPGQRFVFHQLSSGSFHNVPTFLSETFLPDLLKLPGEAEDFRKVNGRAPPILIDRRCRLTTVFDVLLNALTENERGKTRHGSCGMGVNETVIRNRNPEFALSLEEFASFSPREAGLFLEKIRTGYVPSRLRELSLKMQDGDSWCELLLDSNVACNAADAMKSGLGYISIIRDAKALLRETEHLVFEGAQGLLLDRNNRPYMPYLTPSDTGSKNPFDLLKACEIPCSRYNTEVCYVTRSYVTRHGAGPLPHECDREDISPGIRDETNVENQWQESLRFAQHPRRREFISAIEDDRKYFGDAQNREQCKENQEQCKGAKVSLMVTHLNETDGKILYADGDADGMIDTGEDRFRSLFDQIYTSATLYAADIRINR
jgi:adenylosuccinate synthase